MFYKAWVSKLVFWLTGRKTPIYLLRPCKKVYNWLTSNIHYIYIIWTVEWDQHIFRKYDYTKYGVNSDASNKDKSKWAILLCHHGSKVSKPQEQNLKKRTKKVGVNSKVSKPQELTTTKEAEERRVFTVISPTEAHITNWIRNEPTVNSFFLPPGWSGGVTYCKQLLTQSLQSWRLGKLQSWWLGKLQSWWLSKLQSWWLGKLTLKIKLTL